MGPARGRAHPPAEEAAHRDRGGGRRGHRHAEPHLQARERLLPADRGGTHRPANERGDWAHLLHGVGQAVQAGARQQPDRDAHVRQVHRRRVHA